MRATDELVEVPKEARVGSSTARSGSPSNGKTEGRCGSIWSNIIERGLPTPDLELPVVRPIAREPTHPGELMRAILDEYVSFSIAEAARHMDISRPALYAVLNGTGAVTVGRWNRR